MLQYKNASKFKNYNLLETTITKHMVWDNPKFSDDSEEVPKTIWSSWWFNFPTFGIFSLLDGKTSQIAMHLLCSPNR